MTSILLALSVFLGSPLAALQQEGWSETSFHRIYLRNGNFIDGKVIADKPNEVVLLLKAGEMSVRRDQIDRLEVVKLRSWNDKPIVIAPPKADTLPKNMNPKTTPPVKPSDTPEAIRKKVDLLVYKAKNASGENRRFFDTDFKDLGDEGAVYLASRLTGLDPDLTASAGACLKALAVEKTIPVLEDLLNHPNGSIRLAAVVGLSFQSASTVSRYVGPLLKDKDQVVRQTALSLIGPTEDVDWFETVAEVAADPSREVRAQAMSILGRLSTKFNLQDKLLRVYMRNLKDSNEGVRADSVLAIGGLGKQENWTILTEALRDQDPSVRGAAAQSLGALAAPESAQDILQAIQAERDKWPRIYLAGAVQRLRLLKAAESIIPWLADGDEDVRRIAEGTLVLLSGQKFGTDQAKWNEWYQGVKK